MSPSSGSAAPPPDDGKRLQALRSLGLDEDGGDPALDRIARLAAALAGTAFASLTFVDEDRVWSKAVVGPLPKVEDRAGSFAAAAVSRPDEVLVVPDTTNDERFADAAVVRDEPALRFCVAVPLVLPGGAAVGSLCAFDVETREAPPPEQLEALRDLAEVTVTLLEGGVRRTALAAAEAELQRQAVVDPLTGLFNRRGLGDRLDDAVALGRRVRLDAAVLMIQVEGLEELRERYGDESGDAAVVDLAERLSQAVREHDLVARTGEDEFVVLLQAVDRAAVAEAAGRLHEALTSGLDLAAAEDEERPVRLRASVGVALHPGDGEDVASLLRAADLAMYEAKAAGGGVRRFTPGASTRT